MLDDAWRLEVVADKVVKVEEGCEIGHGLGKSSVSVYRFERAMMKVFWKDRPRLPPSQRPSPSQWQSRCEGLYLGHQTNRQAQLRPFFVQSGLLPAAS